MKRIVRLILTGLLISKVYAETGIGTALSFLLIAITVELILIALGSKV